MRTRRRRPRAGLLIGAAVVVAVLAGGGVAWARSGGSPGYRTAAVSRGSVTSTLTLAGTITPLQSASVGFAQSGTVATVDVAAGQTVTAGQTLAQLDLTSLQAKLRSAQATEAAARQTLAEAEDGQLPSGSGSGGGSGGGSGSGDSSSAGSATSRSGSSTSTAAVTSAQKAVQTAQQAVEQAQGAARSALAAATSACGDPGNGAVSGSGGGSGNGVSGSGNSGGPDNGGGASDCLSAETAAMQAENTLSARQNALASAQSTLAQQVTKATSASTGSDASSSASTTVSAAQLGQYQAALDADSAAVAVAQQNLDQGTAVSPLSGTVVSVGITPGASVSAGSSTQVIVISSPNGYEVDASVPTADIASVAVGQSATVAPDGATGTLSASLTSISPTATSSGFPVVVGLSGTDTALRQGASATVTLTTGSVSNAIVVPTSAVHALGTRHVVEVLDGSSLQPAVVTTGVRGPLLTQVVSGLKVGQQVVLADLSSTVTSDSTTTTGTRSGLTGGGAGLGAGGRFATGGGFAGGAGFAGRQGAGG